MGSTTTNSLSAKEIQESLIIIQEDAQSQQLIHGNNLEFPYTELIPLTVLNMYLRKQQDCRNFTI